MRVMLVTNGLRFGGAERVVQALAEDLTAAGHAVLVVATTRGGEIAESLAARAIPVEVLGIRSAIDLRVPLSLRRLVTVFRPDVVHSHLVVSDIVTTAAGAPNRVCTVHNPGVELGAVKRWLWHRTLPRFSAVTAVSKAVQSSLPVPARLLRPSLVRPDDAVLGREAARARLGLPAAAPVVLAVGRLHRIKGFDLLAAAAARMGHEVVFAVIGDGPERAALEGSRLTLLGARDDAAQVLAGADVLVMPSRSEGFPQVPLQAMLAGVPVVATRVGGTPEIVVSEQTGLLTPPEDPAALAAALERMLADPDRARRWGRAGRARLFEAGFTRAAMVEATVSLYREVTGQ